MIATEPLVIGAVLGVIGTVALLSAGVLVLSAIDRLRNG